MKQHPWVVFICAFIIGLTVKAQTPEEETIELTIENIELRYTTDTAIINKAYSKAIQSAPNAAMRLRAISDAEDSYTYLVNEYFKLLFQNLKKEERIMIMNDQRRWKKFIQTQLKLYSTFSRPPYVHKDQYQNQYIHFSKKYLEQTKERLNSLYVFIRSVHQRNYKGAYQIERECVSPLL
ncbi:hypothetical protein OAT16_08660 [Prolixibacteraceae bacterium]|nr:hypothetical protein [Prolixibacteraceae bacterium]